ncbi:MAG: serine hydrolase domain-containing protein [Pseudomonadota bacterium]
MRGNILLLIFLAVCATACTATGDVAETERMETSAELAALSEAVPALLEKHGVPSVSVAYVEGAKVAWSKAWGEAAPGQPATADTLYDLASMTKPVVAETILRLVSKGEVSLDEPMSTYWVDPDIVDDPRHEDLTPRIALQHRTGFPNWRPDDGPLAFGFDPGGRNGYSGEGFEYVARFVERKTGAPFLDLLEEHVLDPAGMNRTAFVPSPPVARSLKSDGEWRDLRSTDTYTAAYGLYATAADYARFLIYAMEGTGLTEHVKTERVRLAENEVNNVCPPPMRAEGLCPNAMGYGLGWMVFETDGNTLFVHSGKEPGRRTLGLFSPEREVGVVVLTNGDNGLQVIRDVVGILYDEPSYTAMLSAQAQFDAAE